MRLFRATAKPLERVPEWSNCCDESKRCHLEMIAQGEMLLDLDSTTTEWMVCICGRRVKEPAAKDMSDHGRRVHLEDCDIAEDETPIEAVPARALQEPQFVP